MTRNVRRVWPTLIANDIVSIQPMNAPVGGIFYYELKYGTNKGSVKKGDNLIQTFNTKYASEEIDKEVIGIGDGATSNYSATLGFTPIKKSVEACGVGLFVGKGTVAGGALKIIAGDEVLVGTDDGEGNIVGDGISGTIDHDTGALSFDIADPMSVSGMEIYANYIYDSECNSNIPEITLDLALCEVKAKTKKLKALWCLNELGTLVA